MKQRLTDRKIVEEYNKADMDCVAVEILEFLGEGWGGEEAIVVRGETKSREVPG